MPAVATDTRLIAQQSVGMRRVVGVATGWIEQRVLR
jgi:hypothetical protein